jgi:exopolyphosphatase/guanosine-5'-triphosphate,3'-diphosphate pyrophosphatase
LTKKIHPDALVRARECLSKFKTLIDQHKPEKILAMATSAARDAENKQ